MNTNVVSPLDLDNPIHRDIALAYLTNIAKRVILAGRVTQRGEDGREELLEELGLIQVLVYYLIHRLVDEKAS